MMIMWTLRSQDDEWREETNESGGKKPSKSSWNMTRTNNVKIIADKMIFISLYKMENGVQYFEG